MLHQVLRKFRAEGVDRKPGDVVETSSWKNERLLLEHRFIGKPSVPQKEAASVVEGANVANEAEEPASGAISKPEPPKATPTEKPSTPPGAVVRGAKSVKPAVLRKRVAVVGKVPAAKVAK